MAPPQGLWDDNGPISQGKILTAIMQDRRDDARQMMRGWTTRDLRTLAARADELARMARFAARGRHKGYGGPDDD
jgi:hypothetical protein